MKRDARMDVYRAILTVALAAISGLGYAQTKVEIVNDVSAKGPCLGIGIGMALVPKCVSRAEKEGFIREDEVGDDGITIGTTGADDGIVTAVAPQSAGALAGLVTGDRIDSVDGKPAHWTPVMEVQRQTFGERGKELSLTVKPAGSSDAQRQITFERGQAAMPPGAPSGSMLVPLMPLVDWRGRFVPCTAAGPMTAATNALCEKHFRPWGYVKARDAGSVGFTVNPERTDAAVVASVEPGSSAEKAGLTAGSIILAVDGKALSGSAGELARTLLFGRAGDAKTVVVDRGGQRKTEHLVLGKKP